MSKITLEELEIGKEGRVVSVTGDSEALRRRLIDMGIITGTTLKMCKRAPMGDPIEISLRGYQLTLRISDARNITLEVFG